MADITLFAIQDVRCFEGLQEAHIKPITVLVGENSTGKSTLLGCYSMISRSLEHFLLVGHTSSYNEKPYLMGSFRDIVRSRGGKARSINTFAFELRFGEAPVDELRYRYEFKDIHSQPSLYSICASNDENNFIKADILGTSKTRLRTPLAEHVFDIPFLRLAHSLDGPIASTTSEIGELDKFKAYVGENLSHGGGRKHSQRSGRIFPNFLSNDVVSIAPLRAERQRSYDPVSELSNPEDSHVPTSMMRLARGNQTRWQQLQEELNAFGHESGLFTEIAVKAFGQEAENPFQLKVKVHSGAQVNLMDVGYGVSQSLPIVVDILSSKNRQFLVQQPEVYLHPRGQAELSDLFAKSFKQNNNRFLIETHSDFILNRFGYLVRKGKLDPDDVSILFFEPKRNSVHINNLVFDELGNIENAPEGYREFFLRETNRVLGFE